MLFTPEHEELRRSLQKFIAAEVNPHVDEWEEAGIFPAHDLFKKMGDLGFLGLTKPVEYGGQGLDYSYAMVMAEELGNIACGSVPMAIGVQTDMATPALARFGSDEVKREFLAPSIAGDYVACLGVSEVGAGSDVASIKTTARKDGEDYVINGGKMWTTNGTQADWMCLLANTSEGAVHKNKSLICLPMKTKGVEIARKLDKLGMRSSDTAQIFFDNVRVPQRYLIGEEGKGFTYQMLQFQEERLWAAAANLKVDGTPDRTNHRIYPQPQSLRQVDPRQSGRAFPAGRIVDRDRVVARAGLPRLRALPRRHRRDAACLHDQTQGRAVAPRGRRCLPAILGRHGLHERDAGEPGVPRRAVGLDRRRRRRNHADHHLQADGHASRAHPTRRSARPFMPDLPQTSHIRLDLRGSVLHLWLDRPELRNALSQQMVREIAATFAAIADERSVRVVVVRGAGGAFCAGGDIKSMSVAHAARPPGATDELKDNNRRFGAMLRDRE